MNRRPGIDDPDDDDLVAVAREMSRVAASGRPALAVAHERAVAAGAPRVLAVRSTAGTLVGDVRPTDHGLVVYARDTLQGVDPDPATVATERSTWGRKRPMGTMLVAFPISDDHDLGGWCRRLQRRLPFTTAEIRRAIDAGQDVLIVSP